MGAVHTYMRRYLYYLAMEIVEHDELDATAGKEKPAKSAPAQSTPQQQSNPDEVRMITEPQRKLLFAISKKAGMTPEALKDYLVSRFALSSTSAIPAFLFNQIKEEIEGGQTNA